jgi:hypothetical protein
VTRIVRAGLVFLVVVGACGDDDAATTTTVGTSTAPTTTTTSGTTSTTVDDDTLVIVVDGTYGTVQILEDGEPRQLGNRIGVDLNHTIRIVVTLAETDEIHVHTYDLSVAAPEGEEVELEFIADIPGIFEVELEDAGTLLFELEVA